MIQRLQEPTKSNSLRYPLPVRLLLAMAMTLGLALLLVIILHLTELGFSVWDHLREGPGWFMLFYLTGLVSILGGGSWLVWRTLAPRRREEVRTPKVEPPRSEAQLIDDLEKAAESGAEVFLARQELEELRSRRAAGEVHVALFGQISMGKSSIVSALLPDSVPATDRPPVDVRGGTTREVVRYSWSSPEGDKLILSDLPGLNEPGGTLDPLAREEALRAHAVIYLVDGDLTRDQYQELQTLLSMNKPLILALNKMDLYCAEDLERIRARLKERVQGAERVEVVAVSAATRREAVRVYPDGREELIERTIPPRVHDLAAALQRLIDESPETLEQLRDAAVFMLTSHKLDAAVDTHRRERSERIISEYTLKAVLGALAAVSPGTDVVIQGYLGVQLVRSLAAVYDVPVQQIDLQRFLELASRRVGKALPLTLAVAGNALKAFPGLGTLTGGIAHAVAYGLLFDSLGRSVARTLESRGTLPPQLALQTFEETLSEDLETRTWRLAKLALANTRRAGGEERSAS